MQTHTPFPGSHAHHDKRKLKAHVYDSGCYKIRGRRNPSTCCASRYVDPPLYTEYALFRDPSRSEHKVRF